MPNYPNDTKRAMADLNLGIRVETGAISALTYFVGATATRLFTVTGRIMVMQLYGEVTVALTSAGAPVVKFQYAATSPVIAAANMSGSSGDIAALAAGARITLAGTAYDTAAAITASPGISYGTVARQIIGAEDFVGYIGVVTDADHSDSGSINFVLQYLPMSTGAFAEDYVAIVP